MIESNSIFDCVCASEPSQGSPVGGGQGGWRPGEQGAGRVRETGGERAGGGISTMAGSGREIQKSSQRNEPNSVS